MNGDRSDRQKPGQRSACEDFGPPKHGDSRGFGYPEFEPIPDGCDAEAQLTRQEEDELAKLLRDFDQISEYLHGPAAADVDLVPAAEAYNDALQSANRILAVMACSGGGKSPDPKNLLKKRLVECEQLTVDVLHRLVRIRRAICG